jgi:hypothetical protein
MMRADHFPTADADRLPEDQRLSDLASRTFEYPAECRPRNIHFCRSFLLRVPEVIGKPECLQFIRGKKDDVEFAQWYARGLEYQSARTACDESLFDGPGHDIMSICS